MKNWLSFWGKHLYLLLLLVSCLGMSIAGAVVLPKSGETYGQQEALAGTAIHQFKEYLAGNEEEAYFDVENMPEGNLFAQSISGDSVIDSEDADEVLSNVDDDGAEVEDYDENEVDIEDEKDVEDEKNVEDEEDKDEEDKDEEDKDEADKEDKDKEDKDKEDEDKKDKDKEDKDKKDKNKKDKKKKDKKKKDKNKKDKKNKEPWLNPEWKLVDESYFDDALFIGDSREQGFGMYSQLENITVYAHKGFQIYTAATKPIVETENGKITIAEALDQHRGEFKKVYIMFGLNEMGWGTDEQVDLYFYNLIDYIKETQPDATVFLQSIIHVSKNVSDSSPVFTNDAIDRRNEHLKEIAKNEHIYYLDLNEIFTDDNNALFSDAASDGIHLKSQYILVWKEYLMAHGIVENDD